MSGRLSASMAAAAPTGSGGGALGVSSVRRTSNSKKSAAFVFGGFGQGSSGRALFTNTFRGMGSVFATQSSEQGSMEEGGVSATTPLITKLDKYTPAELKEYRQIFNMFDADRSGAIGLDELENAIQNLGMDSKQIDVEMLMREADKRGNHQIDFDEFCEVMKTTSEKTQTWNDFIKECFFVFDRSECGLISRKDFEFVLREVGDIQNGSLIEELFTEYDVDYDGFIDFDEFSFLVKNYLTDEDVVL
ncbi:EF hand domain-containing protein [Ditylenchus destructor]|uniref:EF hand domain-containing protein n=1 Tax=Ditylenchus destructor TaxID=166010 RepID=A0AAD4RAA0_9BILA|nr:EF hand domain-containing protein [Ditylenchus destructor]